MSNFDKEAFNAALRQDLRLFVQKTFSTTSGGETYHANWHVDAISEALRQVETGKIRRLLVTLPPRKLKSTIMSVAYPAWTLGRNPNRKIICASYGQELAGKFSRDTRKVMQSSWYGEVFPGTVLSKDKLTEMELHTTANGCRYASSVNGPLTGMGAGLIIVDDPQKALETATSPAARQQVVDWYCHTLLSRLNNKSLDPVIVTMQRVHGQDLAGFLLEQGGWDHLCIPAEAQTTKTYSIGPAPTESYDYKIGDVLDPVHEPKKTLEEIRLQIGNNAYSAQYLQDPLPDGATTFSWAWFKPYGKYERPEKFDFLFQSWDIAVSTSASADYAVCSTWGVEGTDRFYLVDLWRGRLPYPELIKMALMLDMKMKPDTTLVEAIGVGLPFAEQLKTLLGNRIRWTTPKDDKEVRATQVTAFLEMKNIRVPADAPWLEEFRKEVVAFPHGKHDDQVDTMVQVLQHGALLMRWTVSLGRRNNPASDVEPPNGNLTLSLNPAT